MAAAPFGVAPWIPHYCRHVHRPGLSECDTLSFERAQKHGEDGSIEHLPQCLRSKDVVLAVARADAQRLEPASPNDRFDLVAESLVAALPVHNSRLFFPRSGRLPHIRIDTARTDAALAD